MDGEKYAMDTNRHDRSLKKKALGPPGKVVGKSRALETKGSKIERWSLKM